MNRSRSEMNKKKPHKPPRRACTLAARAHRFFPPSHARASLTRASLVQAFAFRVRVFAFLIPLASFSVCARVRKIERVRAATHVYVSPCAYWRVEPKHVGARTRRVTAANAVTDAAAATLYFFLRFFPSLSLFIRPLPSIKERKKASEEKKEPFFSVPTDVERRKIFSLSLHKISSNFFRFRLRRSKLNSILLFRHSKLT